MQIFSPRRGERLQRDDYGRAQDYIPLAAEIEWGFGLAPDAQVFRARRKPSGVLKTRKAQ